MSLGYAGPSLEVREVILRLERSVDDGKLRLRGACDAADAAAVNVKSHGSFLEDVRLRDEFAAAVGSYSPFWLRAALHTILGNPGDITAAAATNKKSAAAAEKAEQAALIAALMKDRSLVGPGAHDTRHVPQRMFNPRF